MDGEIAFYIAIEVWVACEVCVNNKLFDLTCLEGPNQPSPPSHH